LESSLVDETTTPASPLFDNPQLEELLTTWADLAADGLLDVPENVMMTPDNRPPLFLGSSFMGQVNSPNETPMAGALLPGGRAGVTASGFAVSSGTAYPDAAYALAKFLTGRPEASGAFFGVSAQKNLPEPMATEGSRFAMPAGATSPEMQALLDMAFANGITASDTRYAPYLETAFQLMRESGLEAREALQQVEAQILERQTAAVTRRDTVQISVTPPITAPELAPGEIALKFGATASISPFPNQEAWEQAMADFAANDPEVGYVELETSFVTSFDEMASANDCFYMPNNEVPQADLSQVLSLGPLLDSDPNFSPNDVIGNALAAVTRDGQVWALPMTLQPVALRYNPDLFSAAGAVAPLAGWTVDEFESALRSLQSVTGENAPFQSRAMGSSYLLLLIAAYGGLPFDYRTDPPTVNFTDPATVNAIQEVLDLAREGLLDYQRLADLGRSFAIGQGEETPPAVFTEIISGFGLAGMMMVSSGPVSDRSQEVAQLTTFPQGTTYTAVSYDLSTAYISAQTQHAEACYRLLNYLAQNPDLFPSMPARRSLLNSPELVAAQGENSVNFYQQLDSLLSQPNTVNIPTSAVSDLLQSFWLNQAFDRYIFDDADLASELAQAEQFTRDYQACTASIPPYDPAAGVDRRDYFQQADNCAQQVDPSFESIMGG
jgi:ABC-type glycerol-3-phosphate transport system substrate-binding protein